MSCAKDQFNCLKINYERLKVNFRKIANSNANRKKFPGKIPLYLVFTLRMNKSPTTDKVCLMYRKRITSTQNHEIVNSSPYISPPFRLIIEIDSICSRISFQKQVKFHCVRWPTARIGLVTQYAVDHRVAQSRELNTVVCSLSKIHAVQVFWVSKPRKLRFSDMERCLRLKYTRPRLREIERRRITLREVNSSTDSSLA